MHESEAIFTSKVAYAEALAAFGRKRREGELEEKGYKVIKANFLKEWGELSRVEVSDDVLKISGELIEKHPLRGFDALHLASAVLVLRELKNEITFVCSDQGLLRAAKKEGFSIFNPESEFDHRRIL